MNDTSTPRQNPALLDQYIDLDPAAPVEVSPPGLTPPTSVTTIDTESDV